MCFMGFMLRGYKKQIEKFLRDKVLTDNPEQILLMAEHDTQTNFRHYSFVKQLFENALKSHKYNGPNVNRKNRKHQNLDVLKQTLSIIANYPVFQLDSEALRNFNRLINDNIHQKQNDLLQKCLVFLIESDPNIQSSPVYIEFVKFYVKDNIQLLKSHLSINLDQQNVLSAIKLFLLRIFQRGFLPRQPAYTRQLYINNHTLLLNKMVKNKTLVSCLMLKKLNYENLMSIKEYYQKQMKQNLYHKKNTILLNKLIDMLPYLCRSFELDIKLIERECKYMRELYVKLFLVIQKPEIRNCIIFYEMIVQSHKNFSVSGQSKDGLKGILQEYCQKIQKLYQSLDSFKSKRPSYENQESKQQNEAIQIQNQQLFLIIKNSSSLNLKSQAFDDLIKQFEYRVSSGVVFKRHFHQIINLFNKLGSQKNLLNSEIKSLHKEEVFQLLDLNELVQLSGQAFCSRNDKIKIALSKSIQQKNIKHVGNQEILNLIKLYLNLALENPFLDSDHFARQQTLIKFVLRFLSDHHQTLPFDSIFQQILEIIFGLQQNPIVGTSIKDKDFNDKDGNYPKTIMQELEAHLKKNNWKTKNSTLKNFINEAFNF